MTALRARLDAGQAKRDRRIDRLIIAQFEMQEADVLGAAPIAPVERIATDEIERARHRLVVFEREHQQQRLAHPLLEQVEGVAGEIGRPPFARAGVLIEGPERVPMLGADVIATQLLDPHRVLRRGAFLAQILALARGEIGEEILEAGVIAIVPVELDVVAQHPARLLEQRLLLGLDKSRMGGGKAVLGAELLRRREQRSGERFVGEQQPRAGRGGEGRGDLQLGVIAPAGALEGIGPAVVEDIFALAVALEIGRQRGAQGALAILDHDGCGLPAAALADVARILQRGQEGVADEGIARGVERVPVGGSEGTDRAAEFGHQFAHGSPAPSAMGASAWARAMASACGESTVQVSTGIP